MVLCTELVILMSRQSFLIPVKASTATPASVWASADVPGAEHLVPAGTRHCKVEDTYSLGDQSSMWAVA